MKPTDEQIILCLAEAEGWKTWDDPDVMKFKQGWTMPEKWCMNPKGVLCFNHDRPDYINDLNAVARVREKLSTAELMDDYTKALEVELGFSRDYGTKFDLISATPRQHAIALARTLKPELFK